MQTEPLHELGSYPSDLDLLRAARAALRGTILPAADGDPRVRAAARQLDAMLRELLHRSNGFSALMHDRVAAALPILRETRTLRRQLRVRGVDLQRRVDSRRAAGPGSGRAAYSSTTDELSAAMPALWQAWQARPTRTLRRRLETVGRRIVAWENDTARALAADPPGSLGGRRRAASAEIDLRALEACLRGRGLGGPDLAVTGLERLSGGFSRATWLLRVQGGAEGNCDYIVRQQMRGGIVQGIAADVRHEFPLLRVLRAAGVAVPAPLLLVTGPNPLRQDFMVMERLPGQAIGNSVGESTRADASLLEDVARALAKLHAVDWTQHHAELRGSRTWHRTPGVSLRQLVAALVEQWNHFIRHNIGIATPAVATGMAWLSANIPERDGQPRIVHGDVTFANMLAEGSRLTALLDWEVACLGDPAKDLAHFKPVVESRMRWRDFMTAYVAAGGLPVDDATLRYYEVFKATTHVAVTYVARGRRFAQAPESRPELTEIGLLQPAVYMQQLQDALSR